MAKARELNGLTQQLLKSRPLDPELFHQDSRGTHHGRTFSHIFDHYRAHADRCSCPNLHLVHQHSSGRKPPIITNDSATSDHTLRNNCRVAANDDIVGILFYLG